MEERGATRLDVMSGTRGGDRWVRVAAGFLAVSYAVGGPWTAILEHRSQTFSQKFSYPPELIYLTCAVQLVCAAGVLVRSLAPWAAAALTAITLGAIASHLRIDSPLTALPAVFYSVVQIWFGLRSRD